MKRIGQRNEDPLATLPNDKPTGGHVRPRPRRATGQSGLTPGYWDGVAGRRWDCGGQADRAPLQLSGFAGRSHAQIELNQARDFISSAVALPQPSGPFRSTTAQV